MSGKGDKQRPTNFPEYRSNYDLIFSKTDKVKRKKVKVADQLLDDVETVKQFLKQSK